MSEINKNKNASGGNNKKDSFIYSISHAKADDITPKDSIGAKMQEKSEKKDIARYIFMAFFALVFIFSLYSIVNTLVEYRHAEDFYKNMLNELDGNDASSALYASAAIPDLDNFGTINAPKGDDSTAYNKLFTRMRSRILALREKNPDIYGWIIVPGTENIDYPVLQGNDNSYYLNHEYTYGLLPAGSIFADYRCDKDVNGNFNTVIYGHNMQNGMMFSEIIKFMDEDFFNNNKYIYLYTDKGIYTYLIFSAFKTDYRYKYIETGFPTGEDFAAFAEEMRQNSKFVREGVSFDTNSRIITLSTCTNGLWSDRYCIQGLLVDAYNSEVN